MINIINTLFKYLSFTTFLLLNHCITAQTDSTWSTKPEIELAGFVDVFYVFDFNQPKSTKRQSFLYNHNRHNEFNLNLGVVKISMNHSKYRANLALQMGTYVNDNYTAEPGVLKNISEANVGISLNKKNDFWLDAGILSSHIGFESAISINNPTLSRSICAENSPYFLTGVKLTYTPNEKLEIAGLITNGWQRIQKLSGNSLPSFGTQLTYSPSKKTLLNWSTFFGSESPDSTRKLRYFSNLYGQFEISKRLQLIAGFDFGSQQVSKQSQHYHFWYTPIIIAQITLNPTWKTAIRLEYYNDESSIIIHASNIGGLNTSGTSINFDYSPNEYIMWRIEGRWLNSKDKIFQNKTTFDYNNYTVMTSLIVNFSEILNKKP